MNTYQKAFEYAYCSLYAKLIAENPEGLSKSIEDNFIELSRHWRQMVQSSIRLNPKLWEHFIKYPNELDCFFLGFGKFVEMFCYQVTCP